MKKFLRKPMMIAVTVVIANFFFGVQTSFANGGKDSLSKFGNKFFATKTWDGGGANTNWSTANNWNPNGVPVAGDDVTIGSGFSVDLDAGAGTTFPATGTLNSLTIVGTLNMDVTGSNTNRALNVSGNVTISAGGILKSQSNTGNLTHQINIGGTFTNNGTFTSRFTTGGNTAVINVTFNGATQSIFGSSTTSFNNLTISSTTSTTLGANITVVGNLAVTTGTFDLSTFTSPRTAAGGTLSVSNGATLKIGGSNGFPSNYGTHTLSSTSTVDYTGTNQAVSGETYGNLKIDESGTATLGGTATVSSGGNLTINSGVFDLGANTINRAAAGGTLTLANGASLKIGGTNTFPTNYTTRTLGASSIVEYSGSGQSVSVQSYGKLILSGSATKTFAGNTTIAGNLTIATGVVVNLGTGLSHSANNLTFGATGQPSGSYGGTGSGAAHINTTFFTATTGIINIAASGCTPPVISGTTSVCPGSTTQLSGAGSPSLSIPWSSATTSAATVSNSGLVTGVNFAGGSSVITYTDNIGCSNTVTITVFEAPTVSFVKTDVQCFNAGDGTLTLTGHNGSGGYTYSITNGLPFPAAYLANPAFSSLSAGQYFPRVKDSNGCQSKLVQ